MKMLADGETHGENHEIRITKFLEATNVHNEVVPAKANGSVALIILHSPIDQFEYFIRLYNHASFRLCADGAANNLHNLMLRNASSEGWEDALRSALPDAIHGDLDSLDDNVRQRYEELGVEVSKDPDQYSTDFGKAVKKVINLMPSIQDVLVLGSIGGRVDQGLGLLGELYREQAIRHPTVRFWLFSEASVSIIVHPGSTVVHTPVGEGLITPNIGILPVYGPAFISTKGLEWDVEDWGTEMGGQMSTSNHIVADSITVTTNRHILLTIERAVNR